MMRCISLIKYALYTMIVSSLILTGCASQKMASDAKLKEVPPQQAADAAAPVDLEKIVQAAEAYYEQGYGYYKERNWTLAEQAFDDALRTLLDSDIDANTHHQLGEAYYKLFYNIRKLMLEQNYLDSPALAEPPPAPKPMDEALLRVPPEILRIEQNAAAPTPPVVASLPIDEADADIRKYFAQFSTARSQYQDGLDRAAQYLPMMRRIFQAQKLPLELVYLPLIESNFRVEAVSPAGAVGLWQFIRSTGKLYGLKVDKWVDERCDPEKSTLAAAKYFRELYDMLGSWELVLAGYYMGEYRVHKAIGVSRTRNIAVLSNTKSFGWGAKQYVARFKAAVLLAKNYEQEFLDDNPPASPQYDMVQMRGGMRLQTVAEKLGVTYVQLQDLNPELKSATIPADNGSYALKVPFGAGNALLVADAAAPPEEVSAADEPAATVAEVTPKAAPAGKYVVHRIQKRGATLAKIADQYGVPVETLAAFNHLKQGRTLRSGQKIKIPLAEATVQVIGHVVQPGETLYRIAKQYQVEVAALQTYNNMKSVKALHIGQTVKVPLARTSLLARVQDKKASTYRVRRGDSLSKIASNFGVSISQLKEWNNFEGSMLYPGSRIKVRD